jgi:hypothetical protein
MRDSWTHSGLEGGRITFDGWQGSMKPEGRRRCKTMIG